MENNWLNFVGRIWNSNKLFHSHIQSYIGVMMSADENRSIFYHSRQTSIIIIISTKAKSVSLCLSLIYSDGKIHNKWSKRCTVISERTNETHMLLLKWNDEFHMSLINKLIQFFRNFQMNYFYYFYSSSLLRSSFVVVNAACSMPIVNCKHSL